VVDSTYQPKVYRTSGGNKMVVASGGEVDIESGGTLKVAGTALTPTAAEYNLLHGVTASTAELNKVDGIAAGAYLVAVQEVTFTETAGAGTYTGTVALPAKSLLLDIQVQSTVLWNNDTSASMVVGDDDTADLFYTAIDLKATDLLVGEVIRFASTGGCEGAGIVAATGHLANYSASARNIIGVVTTVGAAGDAGRTTMRVIYATLTAAASAATKA
jgi:hypothetical protein